MSLPPDDRAKIEAIRLCGPRMADYVELVGIDSFDALADADANDLCLAINAALGRPLINAMGVRALKNAIDVAKRERRAKS